MDAVGIGFLDGYYHKRVGNINHSLANTGLTRYASKNGSRYIDIAQSQATLFTSGLHEDGWLVYPKARETLALLFPMTMLH
jgi:hypothetical protein